MADKLQQAGTSCADPSVGTAVCSRAVGARAVVSVGGALPPGQRPPGEHARRHQRLRPQLGRITGLRVFLNPVQELRIGGRSSNSTYQYTLKADNQADLEGLDAPAVRADEARRA